LTTHPPLSLRLGRSARGKTWRARLTYEQDAQAIAIGQQTDIPDSVARILAARGVTAAGAQSYLDPTLRSLMPDPDVLVDMAPLVARLLDAARAQETIAIFGDYDVDGACSAALMAHYLDALGCPTLVHIPDRIFEGYGPNAEAIRALHAQGATLLICVDCGTTSFEPFAVARQLNMDVLVLDHHQAPELLPEVVALVNPNRQDDISGLGYLCAAGVVYLSLVALSRALRQSTLPFADRAPDLLQALDLVALATVADVVPLKGLNRAYVVKGLAVMKLRQRPGLRALMDVARLDSPPNTYHLGFLLAPRINAGGRIGDAAMGVRLLTTADEVQAMAMAVQLDRLNGERQAIEASALMEAEAQALLQIGLDKAQDSVLLVAEEGWHPGVMGLVAARLKEKFTLPAFSIAWSGDMGTGSGRSIAGVDLGAAVRKAAEAGLILKGGGHAMAAGVTLQRDQQAAFQAFMNETLGQAIVAAKADASLPVDSILHPKALQMDLIHQLEHAGPFGSGSPEPVFVLSDMKIVDAVEVGTGHVRVRLRGQDGTMVKAMAFRALGTELGDALQKGQTSAAVAVAGTLSVNHWGGREEVQFRIIDIAQLG
jgi:single-stranded-DNA-specific exonuclease